jgi:hypothetical protein
MKVGTSPFSAAEPVDVHFMWRATIGNALERRNLKYLRRAPKVVPNADDAI